MAILIGLTFALAVGLFALRTGLDRDRAFYPTVMIVIAFYYVLFGVIGESPAVLAIEIVIAAAFIALSMLGFKRSLWFAVAALAAHGVMDTFHAQVIPNRGVPLWWPDFCAAYDLAAAAFLGWRLRQPKSRAD